MAKINLILAAQQDSIKDPCPSYGFPEPTSLSFLSYMPIENTGSGSTWLSSP